MRIIAPIAGTIVRYDGLGEGRTYRVTSWLKEMTKPQGEGWINDILFEAQQKIDGKRLVFCTREEAEFVSLTGVCGVIASIGEITVIRMVEWTKERIEEANKEALLYVGSPVF